jgi:hypothetical protein
VTPTAGTIRNSILGGRNWNPPTHSRDQARAYVEQLARAAQPQAANTT